MTIVNSHFSSARLTYSVENMILRCHSNRHAEGKYVQHVHEREELAFGSNKNIIQIK